jgi:hypothetical protein
MDVLTLFEGDLRDVAFYAARERNRIEARHVGETIDRVVHARLARSRSASLSPVSLDHPPIVDGDYRVDQIATERPQAGKRSLLVGAGEPAVADYVSRENGSEFTSPRHGSPSTAEESSTAHRS